MAETKQTIRCPHCDAELPLDEALTRHLRKELEQKHAEAKARLEQQFAERQAQLFKERQALTERLNGIEAEVDTRVQKREAALREQIEAAAGKRSAIEREHLAKQLAAAEASLLQAQKEAVAGLQAKAEAERKERELELTVERRLAEMREQIAADMRAQLDETHQREKKQWELHQAALLKKLEEAQRRLEQGSQQMQGEAPEVSLEEALAAAFPLDDVAPVPKGVRGADVVQRVRSRSGLDCGTILWESKDTKAWSEKWVAKLKDDQRALKADAAVIVSTARPDDIAVCAERNGVWICAHRAARAVAELLRAGLVQVSRARVMEEGRSGKADALYSYLTSQEFKQRVEAVVEAFTTMQADLDKERTAVQKLWAKREMQIRRALEGTIGLTGDMEGILGNQLPRLEALELPEPDGSGDGPAQGEFAL